MEPSTKLRLVTQESSPPQPQYKEEWEKHWQWCKPLVEQCLKYQSEYDILDVETGIATGKLMLWPHPNQQAVFITELVDFPQYRAMNLLFLAGNMSDCEAMLPSIEAFARIAECKKLFGGGRKAWSRYATNKHGFKKEFIISKEL